MFQVIKLLCLKPSSTNKSDIGLYLRFCLWTRWTHRKLYVLSVTHMDAKLQQTVCLEAFLLLCEGELHMTIFSSFSANLLPHYHTILAINLSMHQIGSLIFNKHDKMVVKMRILF